MTTPRVSKDAEDPEAPHTVSENANGTTTLETSWELPKNVNVDLSYTELFCSQEK